MHLKCNEIFVALRGAIKWGYRTLVLHHTLLCSNYRTFSHSADVTVFPTKPVTHTNPYSKNKCVCFKSWNLFLKLHFVSIDDKDNNNVWTKVTAENNSHEARWFPQALVCFRPRRIFSSSSARLLATEHQWVPPLTVDLTKPGKHRAV